MTHPRAAFTIVALYQAMQKLDFTEAVEAITATDLRYHSDAYYFLRDALDHTMKIRKRALGEGGHVTGQQLCEGLRQYAIKQFGPMVPTVFEHWRIKKTDDFGEMVWNLCELGVFGRTEKDDKKDFQSVYDFREAFCAPFEPAAPHSSSAVISEMEEDVPF